MEDDAKSFKQYTARSMGPGLRRDDVALCNGRQTMISHLRPGVIAALAGLALDQASKLWLLFVYDLAHRRAVKVTPLLDLILPWNAGNSVGWFQKQRAHRLRAQTPLTTARATAP